LQEDEQLIVERVEDDEDADEEGSVFEIRRESLDLDDFRWVWLNLIVAI
jgi:hypothetical protein